MDYREFAQWLYEGGDTGATDEEFAEFFVYLFKIFKPSKDLNLTAEDMRSFKITAFTTWLGGVLDEIIYSDDIDASAWWKGETA